MTYFELTPEFTNTGCNPVQNTPPRDSAFPREEVGGGGKHRFVRVIYPRYVSRVFTSIAPPPLLIYRASLWEAFECRVDSMARHVTGWNRIGHRDFCAGQWLTGVPSVTLREYCSHLSNPFALFSQKSWLTLTSFSLLLIKNMFLV
ncbi:hypothetical protein CEXT_759891 [Caerostris extrusa]|uniref:Uncharacterized protein n=1 Tax=Caerostris extrusa TaxID=172846 RepID=A0AAV4XEF4_CAEEX|nr:hypothetical protein CEXT_759891 [Caerostris extrusa]